MAFNYEVKYRQRLAEISALKRQIEAVRNIGPVHDSWGASDDFKAGWRKCLEMVNEKLEQPNV